MSEDLLSKRSLTIEPSLTLEISAKAKKLAAEGQDICNLSAGEPDFDAPKEVISATSKAIINGFTKYGPAAGDLELRNAIANKLRLQNNIKYDFENILVTNGAKQAIYNLFQVLLNEGDEVIIPSPYWLSYPQIVKLAGGKPIILETSPNNGFKVNVEQLKDKISSKTKFIIINSPNNPTGKVLCESELLEIIEVIRPHDQINILSDEIYELILENKVNHIPVVSLAKGFENRIYTVNGFAKGWAMTGWRVGYLAGRKDVIKASSSLQSQSTSNVCSFAQRGAIEALKLKKEYFEGINLIYDKRRQILSKGLMAIENIHLNPPNGAFYAFPQLPNTNISSVDFCKKALEDFGLVVVPGKAFGNDQCIRISCATSTSNIIEGLNRLKKAIKKFY